jgi:hypothetical protein
MDWTHAFAASGTTKLFLDEEQKFWISVRDEINHAEQRTIALGAFKRVFRDEGKEEVLELDRKAGADLKVLTYLVDWNIPGPDGKTADITGSPQVKADAVANLTPSHYRAVEAVIDAHVLTMAGKKTMNGVNASAPTSD